MNNYFTNADKLINNIIENTIGYYHFSKNGRPYLIDVFEISVSYSDPIFDEVKIYTIKMNNKTFFIYKYLKADGICIGMIYGMPCIIMSKPKNDLPFGIDVEALEKYNREHGIQ